MEIDFCEASLVMKSSMIRQPSLTLSGQGRNGDALVARSRSRCRLWVSLSGWRSRLFIVCALSSTDKRSYWMMRVFFISTAQITFINNCVQSIVPFIPPMNLASIRTRLCTDSISERRRLKWRRYIHNCFIPCSHFCVKHETTELNDENKHCHISYALYERMCKIMNGTCRIVITIERVPLYTLFVCKLFWSNAHHLMLSSNRPGSWPLDKSLYHCPSVQSPWWNNLIPINDRFSVLYATFSAISKNHEMWMIEGH